MFVRYNAARRWYILLHRDLHYITRQRPTPHIGHSVERRERHSYCDIRTKRTPLNLGFSRESVWIFETEDVARPIIGAHFLYHFGLLVDVRHKRLIGAVTNKFVKTISIVDTVVDAVKAIPLPQKWTNILKSFPSVTRESPVPDKFLHQIEHELHTTGSPLFSRPRRLPPDRHCIARQEFEYMCQKGICRSSASAWASPLLLVPKKDCAFRPYEDYQRLNEVTRADRYPLSHLHDFTANLAGSTVFTKLDLVRA
jgi:hypothetical protein